MVSRMKRQRVNTEYGPPVKPNPITPADKWGKRDPYFTSHESERLNDMLNIYQKPRRKPRPAPEVGKALETPRDCRASKPKDRSRMPQMAEKNASDKETSGEVAATDTAVVEAGEQALSIREKPPSPANPKV
ncbi:hypothetical protein LTR62_000496 [Meristemomyces frigidus]|uniref:Uncharacterized protein n=1 Tax=Meristemomyces frigidus TaxID=1508187 RepID=A0AAN7YLK1_9PEZI|nr:hypothetical protein LTR62_000496 [Meristemomyces frigidus]